MRSAVDIKKLRCSKGYFSQSDMTKALCEAGCKMTRQGYTNRESGHTTFTAKEIRALSKILEISLEDAFDYFCEE